MSENNKNPEMTDKEIKTLMGNMEIAFDSIGNTEKEFLIGDYKISQLDVDYILIKNPYGRTVKICGGDFESILSGMFGVERND